jgi:hypothetical protein
MRRQAIYICTFIATTALHILENIKPSTVKSVPIIWPEMTQVKNFKVHYEVCVCSKERCTYVGNINMLLLTEIGYFENAMS